MGDKKVREIYNQMSTIYDKARVMDYYSKTVSLINSFVKKPKSSILDIGCGTGAYSIDLTKKNHKVIGVDFSPDMIKKAKSNAKKAKSKCKFLVHDAEQPLPKEISNTKFDLVIFNSSWEFIPNPIAALKNIKANLAEDGLILIITPNPLTAPAIITAEKLKIKKLSPAFYFFNSFKFRTKKFAEEAGLKLISYKYRYKGLDVTAVIRK